VLQRSQLAAGNDFVHALGQRVVAVVERLHHDQPGAVGRVPHRLGFGAVRGERFLAQHVLSGRNRFQHPLRVQAVGKRVVDGVDVGVGDDVVVRGVHVRDAPLQSELLGPPGVARRDRDHLGL
jgi:hypothetical protein